MDKELILAVAGSGKTRLLIDRLNDQDRFLIITYTENNYANLRVRVIEKFGHVPENIKIITYFKFLYNFCFKPLLGDALNCKGINWEIPPFYTQRLKRDSRAFYFDKNDRLYHNRMAKIFGLNGSMPEVKSRLEKYYDFILVDEVQDFGGHDLNFLCSFAEVDLGVLLVGDFFQHTFDTGRFQDSCRI